MKRFIPDSIAARTILVLLLGLTVSHVASMAIYYSDRADALASLGGSQIAERIAAISRLVEGSGAAERERIIKAVNGPTLRVTWSRKSLLPESKQNDWHASFMGRDILLHLGDFEAARLRVDFADAPVAAWPPANARAPMTGEEWPEMMRVYMRYMWGDATLGRSLRVSLRLPDQTWLNFVAPRSAEAPFWSLRFVLSMLVMAVAKVEQDISPHETRMPDRRAHRGDQPAGRGLWRGRTRAHHQGRQRPNASSHLEPQKPVAGEQAE